MTEYTADGTGVLPTETNVPVFPRMDENATIGDTGAIGMEESNVTMYDVNDRAIGKLHKVWLIA